MRFKKKEGIYSKGNNNEINRKKYKHALSPFCKSDAGNVEFNVNKFNQTMGDVNSNISTVSMGESLNEDINSTIDDIIDYLKPGLDWLEDK